MKTTPLTKATLLASLLISAPLFAEESSGTLESNDESVIAEEVNGTTEEQEGEDAAETSAPDQEAKVVMVEAKPSPEQPVAETAPGPATASTPQTGLEIWTGIHFLGAGTDFPLTMKKGYLTEDIGDKAYDGGGYTAKPSFTFGLGGRIFDVWSIGAFFTLPGYDKTDDNNSSEGLTRSVWGAGVYTRFYTAPLIEPISSFLDITLGVGGGYYKEEQKYTAYPDFGLPFGRQEAIITMDAQSLVVPIQAGVGYRILPRLSLSALFEYQVIVPIDGCIDMKLPGLSNQGVVGNKYCKSGAEGDLLLNLDSYSHWMFGLELRGTLF